MSYFSDHVLTSSVALQVSSLCDDFMDQINMVSFLGDEVLQDRCMRLRFSLKHLNQAQGLGFVGGPSSNACQDCADDGRRCGDRCDGAVGRRSCRNPQRFWERLMNRRMAIMQFICVCKEILLCL